MKYSGALALLFFALLINPLHSKAQSSPVYYMSNYLRVVQPEFDDTSDLASKAPDYVSYHNPKAKYDTLLNPFTGGLNNPMFFNIDFNGDGISDLYVFDRDAGGNAAENQFLLFEGISNYSTIYRYAPQYAYAFPHDVGRWVEIADYNNDGKPDLFTGSPTCNTCIKAYQNTSYLDPSSHKFIPHFSVAADPLYYVNDTGAKIEIDVNYASNPQFLDVDKDGYLDILAFGESVYAPSFYRNRGIKSDNLSFYFTKACWGYFEERVQHFYTPWNCEKGWTGTYDPDTAYNRVHSSGAHGSNSMCAFDVDCDGDIDLLLGDGLNDSLAFLKNGNINPGGKNYRIDTMINILPKNDDTFPVDYPAVIPNMPTAYNLDVNHDSLVDLIIDAGEPTTTPADTTHFTERIHNIWYYHNKGSKASGGLPQSNIFQLSTKDFLQNTMVDWGAFSAPCFIDVDKDGRKDLIIAVGDGSKPYGNSHLILYLNKAGKTASSKPYLLYQTDDYLGFSKLKFGISRPVPAAYLNTKDSTTDLILGNDSGQIMYFKDRSTGKNPADFQLAESSLKYLKKGKLVPISVNANSSPTAANISGHGKTDLLIGSNDGTISYYRCQGFGPAPDYVPYFVLVTDTFGRLFTTAGLTWQTAPCVADLDKDGKPDLLVGDVFGNLYYFHDFDTTSTLIPNNLVLVHDYGSGKDSTQQFSTYTIPAVASLDQDGLPDIMLGCRRGGLLFLGSANNELETLHTSGIEQPVAQNFIAMSLFPNPAKNTVTLEYNNPTKSENTRLVVSDMLGRQVIGHIFEMQNGKGDEQFSTSGLSNGIYIVNVESGGQILFSNKLVISK